MRVSGGESGLVVEVWNTRKSWFAEEQIAFALRQAEAGTPIVEVCRKMGISERTFF